MGLVRALALGASCLLVGACTDSVRLFGAGTAVGSSFGVGWSFSCVHVGGRIACAGSNADGALGQPFSTTSSLMPTFIETATDYRTVDTGNKHACAIREGGVVECWGHNGTGQLGLSDTSPRDTPTRVALELPAIHLCVGFEHTCILVTTGALYCFGLNHEGQNGLGDTFGTAPESISTPMLVPGFAFSTCAAGQGHTCAIDADRRLYCWGRNSDGELGIGEGVAEQTRSPTLVELGDFIAVAVGQDSTCGIREGGLLYCWGHDGVSATGEVGPLGMVGDTIYRVPTPVADNGGYETISIDTFHACATRNGGELWCWGRNDEGQLGLGDMLDREIPTRVGNESDWAEVVVGRFATCARKRDGRMLCAGANTSGELLTGDAVRHLSFTPTISP